ncbi:hypothetical protein [Actinoallomurus iriomotensis]|uniref:Uncharacterized protein n=1 Tax=Actinoallomurus iriomotensis TaxID=478107 RepID=A0A9W6VSB7_9ACTN|nr:hypothetical protein [Actinoallomurus iriomotensis]GLY75170.1 hypothetical protein Airi01_034370 [Actinoallomurus iriomotensis]GLY83168.1 hypothetical protein Airi02_010980 [Actinoallomurus iriomotensis]
MPGQHGLDLSITQLIAGAAATITATVASSYFGVGGTLIGAGAVSVLSTAGATVYQHFLDRGKERIAAKIPVRAGGGTGDGPPPVATTQGRPWPKWYVVLGAAGVVFLAVMGLVTAFELFTGRPLSNTVRGQAGRGTSVHPVVAPVRPPRTPPVSRRATAEATATSSVAPLPGTTARTTPTPSPSRTLRPMPGERSAEATAGPPAVHSAAPPATPDDDGSLQTP